MWIGEGMGRGWVGGDFLCGVVRGLLGGGGDDGDDMQSQK